MRKFLLVAFLFTSTFSFAQSINYGGNGKQDFGGGVGKGSLNITTTTDSIFFTLTKGPGAFNDVLVFYVDAIAGGISSTVGYNNNSDIYASAVSGYSAADKVSRYYFPAGFQADAAIAFNKDGGKVFFFQFGFMFDGGPLTITPTGTNTSPTYKQSASKSDIGVSGPLSFNFVGTYVSSTAGRSAEGFGDTSATFLPPNSGWAPYIAKTFFRYNSTITLAVRLIDFKAAKVSDDVNINWSVADETNINAYEVQRSTDGINFTTIETVKAKNSSAATAYSIKDLTAKAGTNYYRLIFLERGRSEISKIVSLNITGGKSSFLASYRSGKMLNVTLNGMNAGIYRISVLNSNGQLVQSQRLQHDGTDRSQQIALTGNLATGIYRVALRSETASYTGSILVQ
jgi:hypothetical protein